MHKGQGLGVEEDNASGKMGIVSTLDVSGYQGIEDARDSFFLFLPTLDLRLNRYSVFLYRQWPVGKLTKDTGFFLPLEIKE